jgi:hypothetical protein
MRAVVRWFAPLLPESRVAILRTVLYAFVLLDIHLFVRDPIPLSRHPELYSPLLLARVLHLPPPSVPLTVGLYLVLLVGCVIAAANRLPRVAGFVVAAAFTWWTAIGMSYGKVDHDHMALVSWPESSILLWAIIRRPNGLGQFLIPYPELLRVMQWFAFVAELTSVVVLWLRGRALLLAALFWTGFHVFTVTILYIHFAPTAVCWLAFAPLERLGPWARGVIARRRQRAGGRPAGHPGAVASDQPVDGRRQRAHARQLHRPADDRVHAAGEP